MSSSSAAFRLMLHSRNTTLILVIAAITGAGLLWWNLADDRAPTTPPASAESVETNPAVNPADGPVPPGEAPARSEVERNPVEAAASAPTDEGPSALQVLAVWPDQTSAADVMIYLHRSAIGLPRTAFARGITDAGGLVVFANPPRGPSTLVSDRQDRMQVTVEDDRQELTFELAGGIAVRGTVSDPSGTPVANAAVWLQSSDMTWSGGRVVGFTNSTGEFELEQILPKMSLGAMAADFAPSKLVDLDIVDQSNPPAVVQLTLLPDAGRVKGTVTNEENKPIARAVVAIGENPRYPAYSGDRFIEQWTLRTAETDEDGCFAVHGIAIGKLPIAIRAAGYGLWRSDVTIECNGNTVVSAQLQRAATLIGTVTDGEGAPLERAVVRVYDKEPRTTVLASGQIGFNATFGYCAAITDADGNYRIEDVTPGTAYVFAQRAHDLEEHGGVTVAYAREQLQVEPGTEASWNPAIEDGATIEGVVLYADGSPIPGLFITLADESGDGKKHVVVSSREGAFKLLCLNHSTYTIHVQHPLSAPDDAVPIRAEGVIPDRGRTVLQATYNKPAKKSKGIVTGRIDDVAGRIRNPNAATIILQSETGGFRQGNKIENGAFRIDGMQPGRFRLTLKENRTVLAESDWFDLEPAATVDTGVLITKPAGGVRFVIERGEGTELIEPEFDLRRAGQGTATTIEVGRRKEVVADNLTPGNYTIAGHLVGMAIVNARAEVIANQTATVPISLQVAATMRCEVWWPTGEPKSTTRKFRILNAPDGNTLIELETSLRQSATRPHRISYTVPPGRWKIEFSTDDGLSGEATFVVKDAAEDVNHRIDLK